MIEPMTDEQAQIPDQTSSEGETRMSSVIADITARAQALHDETADRLAALRAEHGTALSTDEDQDDEDDQGAAAEELESYVDSRGL